VVCLDGESPYILFTSVSDCLSLCVEGRCAKQLTIEFYTVVMLLTFILVIMSIPSPPHSFIPDLKPSFSANPFHRSLPFLLRD